MVWHDHIFFYLDILVKIAHFTQAFFNQTSLVSKPYLRTAGDGGPYDLT